MNITLDLIWLCSYLTGYMTLSPWLYRTVYPWYRCDSLYSVIFSLSNIECILTRTRVWGFALNSIPYGISIGADTVHSALFHFFPFRSDILWTPFVVSLTDLIKASLSVSPFLAFSSNLAASSLIGVDRTSSK